MNTRHWSDAYANTAGLADEVERIAGATPRAVGAGLRLADALKTQAVPDLSSHKLYTVGGEWSLAALADAADMYADVMAKAGNYPAYVVLTDASAALRELAEGKPDEGITTGTFRALRSSCIAGVTVTEHVAECDRCKGAGCSSCTDDDGLPL